ncbi:hypothetical protein ZWY2020_031863 [Hordeum vulgare]|nr:hypothetical protein ZWY2020_031863 [Hordeum vulgare]
MQLSCSGDDAILDHHVLGSCKVTEIYYRHRVINVIPLEEPSMQCPVQKLISTDLATDVYKQPQSSQVTTLCEHQGRHCGFSSRRRQAFCHHHGIQVIPIAASSVAAFVVLSMMVATAIYLSLKSRSMLHGKGLSRFWSCVEGYKGPTLIQISAFSNAGSDNVDGGQK